MSSIFFTITRYTATYVFLSAEHFVSVRELQYCNKTFYNTKLLICGGFDALGMVRTVALQAWQYFMILNKSHRIILLCIVRIIGNYFLREKRETWRDRSKGKKDFFILSYALKYRTPFLIYSVVNVISKVSEIAL